MTRRRWSILPCVLCMATACANGVSLPDTPIEGATSAVEALIRGVLLRFDDQVGADRVRVRRVLVSEMEGGKDAEWRPATATIVLSPSYSKSFPQLLRHELCHALDAMEGPLFRDRDPLYDRLARGLESAGLLDEDSCRAGSRCSKEEAFAIFCSTDGILTQAIANSQCMGDPDDATAVAAHLMHSVWIGALPSAAHLGPPEEFSVPADVLQVWSDGTQKPSTIRIAWDDGASSRHPYAYVDVHTALEDADEPAEGWLLAPVWRTPPLNLVGVAGVPMTAGWPEGPATAFVEIDMFHLGTVERTLWTKGAQPDHWTTTDPGCVPQGTAPFGADGAVYTMTKRFGSIGWQEMSDAF